MKPTTEQINICELTATGTNVLIEALAGSGKTSTGKLIANHLPDKTCLSIFFNKKNAEEGMSQADRPSNMFYSTIHSLCYKQVMNAGFKSKLNNFLLFEDIDTSLLVKLLSNEEAYGKGEYQKELNKLQRIVLDCMKLWQQSDSKECYTFVSSLYPSVLGFKRAGEMSTSIEELDLAICQNEEEEAYRRSYIARTCSELWTRMSSSTDKAKITHDTYVKLFQLQGLTFRDVWDNENKMYLSIDLLIADEIQDSNGVTLAIIANQKHLQQVACGDKNQCLIEGTIIDGKPIETFKVGDSLATVIKGIKQTSTITDIFKKQVAEEVISLTTKSGKTLTSTKTHTHIVEGMQQKHGYVVYLMFKQGYGFRVGSTKDFRQRQSSERCDRAWVIKMLGEDPVEARVFEQVTAFTYGIPTLIYVNREGKNEFTDAYYKEVFSKIDSTTGALKLLEHCGLSFNRPHFLPQATTEDRMTLTITTMGDIRGRSILHKFSAFLSDEQATEFGSKFPNYSIRVSKKGREGYRIENSTRDMQVCFNLLQDLQSCFPQVEVKELIAVTESRSLQLKLASDLHIGMSVQVETETGFELEEIVSIEKSFYEGFVYDFNVKNTHNFIANGITTHNCIYGWRGAKNDFSSFASWNKATLTESFRFGQDIADLANKVLALPAMDTSLRLIGRGTDKGTGQTAILCRTNATVLQIVFTKLLLGEKVSCVSKFNEMESMMYHIFAILNEQEPKFPVASLKSFDTKEKMWQAIESNQELKQVYKLATMISDAKGGLFTGLKYLKDNLVRQEKADFIVSTIHASKGLGFTNVIIADDFLVPTVIEGVAYYEDAIEDLLVDRILLSMLYVAITRAKESVKFPWYLESMVTDSANKHSKGFMEVEYTYGQSQSSKANNSYSFGESGYEDNENIPFGVGDFRSKGYEER